MVDAKKSERANALRELKRLCKEFGFTAGVLKGALAEGRKQKTYNRLFKGALDDMSIKVFGERNTGTNALIGMLKNNSESKFCPGTMSELSYASTKKVVVLQKLGLGNSKKEEAIDRVFKGRGLLERWKHSATFVTKNELSHIHDSKFIFTVRHPLSWLVGLYKNPYHILIDKPDDLVSFANTKWRTVGRENVALDLYKPLDLLEEKLKSYVELMEQLEKNNHPYKIIQFEKFVSNQKATFDYLRVMLDEPSVDFEELIESTKEKKKNSKFYASYYDNEIWRKDFPEIENIKNTISRDLLSSFGYE